MVIALYLCYLAICAALTVVVGIALGRSGRVVMTAMFGDERLADAVSRLVVLTLYLLNFGYVALTLGATAHVTAAQAFGVLPVKLGEELLVLGGLHLTGLTVLARMRRRHRLAGDDPAAAPWLAQRPPRVGAGTRSS